MSSSLAAAAGARGASAGLRSSLPVALLVVEYLALSFLVDFPTSGPAMRFVSAARMLVPAVIGGGAAGWLLARHSLRDAAEASLAELGPWRPWPALGVQLAAFTATGLLATRLFGNGAPVGPLVFALWLTSAAATVLLAFPIAAPAPALLHVARHHLRVPLLAAGIGLLSWRAVAAAEGLWGIFQAGTLRAVAALLQIVSGDVVIDPARSLVGANGFEVLVAPVCSGVDGLGLVVVFQAAWLSFARARVQLGRALLLLVPLGAVAALAANVLRIGVLILVGASGREDLAMGAFHSKLGWMLFVAIALASVALAEHVPWLRRRGASAVDERQGVPRAAGAYLAPLVAALSIALVTSLWADPGLDRAYGLRVVVAMAALLAVRRSLPSPSLSFSVAPLLVGGSVAVVWIASGGAAGSTAASPLVTLGASEQAVWLATRLLGSCVVLPIVEELAFRGFLLRWLVAPDFEVVSPRAWTWPAVVLSSLAFGALHEQWLLGALAGLAFAAARLWRGRLGDAIIAHAIANAAIAAAVLLGGRWDLWR